MPSAVPPIRVAISGGGLAGATVIHALLQHSNLDVHIFESAPAFKEAGAAIGLPLNATRALALIGPSATASLKRAGAVPQAGVKFQFAYGPEAGSIIDEVKAGGDSVVSIVHRAAFLRELLADVPPERMHASKKLIKVHEYENSMTLEFQDGSTHECDLLIGADGIHSRVRKLILGDEDAAAEPVCGGFWLVQALKPYEEARSILGEDLVDCNDPHEYGWVGDGTFMMHNVLGDGKVVQLMLGVHCDPSEAKGNWQRVATREELLAVSRNAPKHLAEGMVQLLCDGPETSGIYTYEHPPARTYVKDRICIVGDAAHATTPWQASGGAMSIEDALILSALLGRAESVEDAKTALKVYDRVRRPRTQAIVKSSKYTGKMMTGRGVETGLDFPKLQKLLLPRWDFIIYADISKHHSDAIASYQDSLISAAA